MEAIQGQEIEMTTLQSKDLWEKAGKWDDDKVDIWFKTKLKNETELGLAFSHEEAIAEMLRGHLSSYKDLPQYIYQFQTKFRNETRAKSGVMRGREFLMKDMYSFNKTKEDMDAFYEDAKQAYIKIFNRIGLGDITYVTAADGSVFGDRSDEFQTLSEAGEDIIYIDEASRIAINEEVYTDEKIAELGLKKENLVKKKSIEVGNIFPIEDKVAKQIDFTYTDDEGKEQPIYMGSYGIGIGRAMGTIVETLSDKKGIVWPEEVSPFRIHLVTLGTNNEDVVNFAEGIYSSLTEQRIEVLYDDRDAMPGEKLADSDLLGITTRMIIGRKTLESGEIEIVDRATGKVTMRTESDVLAGKTS